MPVNPLLNSGGSAGGGAVGGGIRRVRINPELQPEQRSVQRQGRQRPRGRQQQGVQQIQAAGSVSFNFENDCQRRSQPAGGGKPAFNFAKAAEASPSRKDSREEKIHRFVEELRKCAMDIANLQRMLGDYGVRQELAEILAQLVRYKPWAVEALLFSKSSDDIRMTIALMLSNSQNRVAESNREWFKASRTNVEQSLNQLVQYACSMPNDTYSRTVNVLRSKYVLNTSLSVEDRNRLMDALLSNYES
jgi:hypothetical protein